MEEKKEQKKELIKDSKLRLIVFESAKELGDKVDYHLVKKYNLDPNKYTFKVPIKENFFADGHSKVEIQESIRGKNVFMMTDVGNYSIEYKNHGYTNHASPNDLYIQLLDGIGACGSHADCINVIETILYAGRQHRKNTRENLACAMYLHYLDIKKCVKSVITFDAHDPGVEQALHDTEFANFFPTNEILADYINDTPIEQLKNIVFVAPDNGATGRRNVYLNSFNTQNIHREAGSFVKQRDYNVLVDGKNPVISHDYSGTGDLEGYTAIVPDDMISSGGSMFEVIEELKKRGVKHIYLVVTFALYVDGIKKFEEYYNKGMLDGVYTTNLSYIPEEYKNAPWLHVCDCSKLVAKIIYNMYNDLSMSPILTDKSAPIKLLEKKISEVKKWK